MNADNGRCDGSRPVGSGTMAALIRSHDWAGTPLGPAEAWPQSLKTAVGIILGTRHPAFICWGPEYTCLYNDGFAGSLGPEKHPVILGVPGAAAWPEVWPIVEPELEKVLAGGEPTWHENRLLPIVRHGHLENVYWTYSLGPIDDADAPNGIGGVLVFCTETTGTVLDRQETQDRYRALFESLDQGFCTVDVVFDERNRPVDYVFVEMNPAFETQTGLQDAAGKSMRALRSDHEEHWFEIYGRIALSGQPERFEHQAAALDRWYAVYAFPIDPERRRVAILFDDITARKQAESAMLAAKAEAEQANRSKSKFLAAASHDLRQPMQSLLLFLDILKPHVAAKGQEALKHLGRGLDALGELLNSLLDVSRLDAGVVEPSLADFPVQELIGEIGAAYTPVAMARGLTFQVSACPAVAHSDRMLLGRMLRNLVENALRYTEAGQISIECHLIGDRLRIEVHDTGIGIPPEHLTRIWEEFHQVGNPERDRNRGLGLGLAIVQRLSLLLDHPVAVRSTPGCGSVFSIDVPPGDAAPRQTVAGSAQMAGQGRFAVLVDDDAIVLLGLKATFEAWGYDVLTAGSADQAMTALSGLGRRPDIVVADYRLRDERNGTEVILRVRDAYGTDVPGIILTGETGNEAQNDAAAHDLQVIHKPVTPRQLGDALERILADTRRSGPELPTLPRIPPSRP